MFRALALLSLSALLAACQQGLPEPQVRRAEPRAEPLATMPAQACWATDRVPALTEIVFEPTETGARVPREVVRRPAEDRLFAVPCPEQMTPEFIASLQRALQVRGLFTGAVTGEMDAATGAAIRAYQAPRGLDSAILSLDGAQQLGLVPVPRGTL